MSIRQNRRIAKVIVDLFRNIKEANKLTKAEIMVRVLRSTGICYP